MQTHAQAGTSRNLARALRRFPPTLVDRDALERFLARAEQLLPPGSIATRLDVTDGERAGSFATLRDLAADPDLPTRLSNVALRLVRSEGGATTHELHLSNDDGRATLVALGDEVWAHGAVAILADLLAVYGRVRRDRRLTPTTTFNYFSAGVTLGTLLITGFYRGGPAAPAVALSLGVAWFLLDMALAEIRLALTPRSPEPLSIEIRSQRVDLDVRARAERIWAGVRLAACVLWIGVVSLVLALVVPHVPKAW